MDLPQSPSSNIPQVDNVNESFNDQEISLQSSELQSLAKDFSPEKSLTQGHEIEVIKENLDEIKNDTSTAILDSINSSVLDAEEIVSSNMEEVEPSGMSETHSENHYSTEKTNPNSEFITSPAISSYKIDEDNTDQSLTHEIGLLPTNIGTEELIQPDSTSINRSFTSQSYDDSNLSTLSLDHVSQRKMRSISASPGSRSSKLNWKSNNELSLQIASKDFRSKSVTDRLYIQALMSKEKKEKLEKFNREKMTQELKANQFKVNEQSRLFTANNSRRLGKYG